MRARIHADDKMARGRCFGSFCRRHRGADDMPPMRAIGAPQNVAAGLMRARILIAVGFALVAAVVFIHLAERFDAFLGTRWSVLSNHLLHLTSAFLGCMFLLLGLCQIK
jgi:hypothetical protein